MADKRAPASGWPKIQGDYHAGNAESPVAVVTVGSHLDEQGICDAGAAICGSCKTENLGLEKIVANVVANPNIRFMVTCGTEVKGHLSGQCLHALHENGLEGGKIVGAKGAIPFIENLTDESIQRFRDQIEMVDIMESEDMGAIKAKIDELTARDPGAFDGEPIVLEVKEDDGGAAGGEGGVETPMTAELALIHARLKTIQMMVTDIGYRNRFAAGVYSGKVEGLMIGLIVSFALLGFLLMG